MLDEELQPGQPARSEAKPLADFLANNRAVLHVVAAFHALAGIVQKQGKVEQVRQVDVLQDMGVVGERGLIRVPDLIEFLEADEGVLVRCVGVKKLVLHEAGHAAELGDVAPQQVDLVHGAHGGGDVATLVENLEKRLVVFGVVNEAVIH